jgi:hypothetical protein
MSGWAGVVVGGFFSFFLCSQHVPFKFPMASHLYWWAKGGEALQLSIESSILVSLHSFNFFCDGPIKLAHYKKRKKKKKVELARHPQLINTEQNK